MSKIGDAPIVKPADVTIEKDGRALVVSGPKGVLKMDVDPAITIELEGDKVMVKRKNDQKRVKALHGLTRSLMANMISGVVTGWSKDLELVGVGFRAQTDGVKLTLAVGFSHPAQVDAPEGISFAVLDNAKIKVAGIDKQLVGQVAANIRSIKPPDVYKGKGIRYKGEYVRKKLGKQGKVGTGAAGGK